MNDPMQNPFGRLADEVAGLRVDLQQAFAWFKSCAGLATKKDLKELELKLTMNAQQLETLLNNQTTQIGKISKEQSDRFDALTAANQKLQELIENGEVTPAIEAAAAGVQTALDNLDAAIPDAVPTPPEPV